MGLLDAAKKVAGAASSIFSVGGTLLDAYGRYRAGQQAGKVYDYNKEFAKFQEKYIDERVETELATLARDVKKVISRQRAIQGRSGTVTDVGSNLDAIINTEQEAAIDAAVIRRQGEVEKEIARKEAKYADKQGAVVRRAGLLEAGSTLLTGLSKWDWRLQDIRTPTPAYASGPPVPAGSGYTPFR